MQFSTLSLLLFSLFSLFLLFLLLLLLLSFDSPFSWSHVGHRVPEIFKARTKRLGLMHGTFDPPS
jgi:hypothetical protein